MRVVSVYLMLLIFVFDDLYVVDSMTVDLVLC